MRASRVRHVTSKASCIRSQPTPARPKLGVTANLASLMAQREGGTVGLELHLPPPTSLAFADGSDIQHRVRRVSTLIDSVIRACEDNKRIHLDYITLRCSMHVPTPCGELWTGRESQLALSFLRDVLTHVLQMIPSSLQFPMTAANILPISYVRGMFEMLHRVGWENLLIELPPPCTNNKKNNNTAVNGETQSPMHRALCGWTSLLHTLDGNDVVSHSKSQCIPPAMFFPYVLREGFLDRFSVGLSVDLYASLQSLALLRHGGEKKDDDGVCMRQIEKSKEEEEESKAKAKDKCTWEHHLKSHLPTVNEMERLTEKAKQERSQHHEMLQVSHDVAQASSLTTLSTPPREFTEMFLAQHKSFMSTMNSYDKAAGGGEEEKEDTMLLAQFLQQLSSSNGAVKKNSDEHLQMKKRVEFIMNEKKCVDGAGVGRTLSNESLYWQTLGEITRRVRAQYLCTTPCLHAVSLRAWRQACADECNRLKTYMNAQENNNNNDDYASTPAALLLLLPVVNTLLPLLDPLQLERIIRQRMCPSNEKDKETGGLIDRDALKVLSRETQEALQCALQKISPFLSQQSLDDTTVKPRRETQILHEGGNVRLLCSSGDSEKFTDMLGASRGALFSDMTASKADHVRSVEETFRQGPMRKTVENIIEAIHVGNAAENNTHLLLSVPRDTEMTVLLESLELLAKA